MSDLTVMDLGQMDHKVANTDNMCDYGVYDWWSKDSVIVRFIPRVVNLAKRITNAWGEFDCFVKENSPLNAGHYFSFVILDECGDNLVWCDNANGKWAITLVQEDQRVVASDLSIRELAKCLDSFV